MGRPLQVSTEMWIPLASGAEYEKGIDHLLSQMGVVPLGSI